MDYDRLLELFREYLFMDEEGSVAYYVEDALMDCGATYEEIAFLKGEVPNG